MEISKSTPPPNSKGDAEEKKVEIEIVQNTSLDLDSYIANYTGYTRILRLEFIGDYCPPLRVDAYKLAIADLKNGINTEAYLRILEKLNKELSAQGKNVIFVESEWVQSTVKQVASKTDKLDADLKTYKTNSIKESIRMGHNDLGDHFYQKGDLQNALKSYTRTRDYCTSSKHIISMCLNVVKASIDMGNFTIVLNYVSKAEATPDVKDQGLIVNKLKSVTGLAHLESQNYKLAARSFVDVAHDAASSFNEVISQQDIGTYGGLCALASFDRTELKKKVIDNQNFREILEVVPIVRQLITDFYNSNYANCLKSLEQIRPELLLDIHLYDHVKSLYENIRKKALIQFFSPYISVDLRKMAATFNTTVAALESELATLIMDNQIQARIDSHNKILYARQADQRKVTYEKAVEVGKQYHRTTRGLLLRINMLRSDFIVRPYHNDFFGK